MKKIKLTRGKYAIVDDEDYDFLKRLKPTAMERDGYWEAVVSIMGIQTGSHNTYLHHFLKRPRRNQVILHKNGNRLDLRKENLLKAGYSIKVHRGRKREETSSIYKGVCLCKDKRSRKWFAYIKYTDSKRINIGYFNTEKEAAIAYNKKAREIYGKLAYQNKV